jgi:hypothetical protein
MRLIIFNEQVFRAITFSVQKILERLKKNNEFQFCFYKY